MSVRFDAEIVRQGPRLMANNAFRDIWIHLIVIGWLGASIIGGIIKISLAYDFPTPLAISILWAGYQIIPPSLVLPSKASRNHSMSQNRLPVVRLRTPEHRDAMPQIGSTYSIDMIQAYKLSLNLYVLLLVSKLLPS